MRLGILYTLATYIWDYACMLYAEKHKYMYILYIYIPAYTYARKLCFDVIMHLYGMGTILCVYRSMYVCIMTLKRNLDHVPYNRILNISA